MAGNNLLHGAGDAAHDGEIIIGKDHSNTEDRAWLVNLR